MINKSGEKPKMKLMKNESDEKRKWLNGRNSLECLSFEEHDYKEKTVKALLLCSIFD